MDAMRDRPLATRSSDASSELFEHTADVGLRVHAASLEALFAEAGRGLLTLLVADPETVQTQEARRVSLAGRDPADLLVDWLTELLYAFEDDRLLLRDFDVALEEGRLEAVARGERFDPTRHQLGSEVKAVTYHGLRVDRDADGSWVAEVILDV